jgi:predicted Zn-dependent protease
MARMFEVLLSQRRSRPGGVQKFFASHPLTENRIRDVRAAGAALPEQPNEITDEAAFRQIRSRYHN